jgi:hypothetical protein
MMASSSATISLGSAPANDAQMRKGAKGIERRSRPVFVVGCHRSGTNLLYDTLLSAGGFAIYRGYLPIYKMLIPRFGSFGKLNNRKNALQAWLRSKGFRRSGLDAERLTVRILNECQTGGDFVRIVMDEISLHQNLSRWAVYDPDNLLYIPKIKADIPEALFIHIVRDGRDVALSLSRMGGFKPLPWRQGAEGLLPTAVYWEWMVRKGRKFGRKLAADYLEIRYEDLVSDPHVTLRQIEKFLDQDMSYERIQNASLGRVREPNSSFSGGVKRHSPVQRWREKLDPAQTEAIEAMVGECLEELGYPLNPTGRRKLTLSEECGRAFYRSVLESKLWLKNRTPLGRLTNLGTLELSHAGDLMEAE